METEVRNLIRVGFLPPYFPDPAGFAPGLFPSVYTTAERFAGHYYHPWVETAHLWFAVGELAGDPGGEFLRRRGLAGPRFVEALLAVWPPDYAMGKLASSAVSRYALNQAVALARSLGDPYADGRHLAVALLGGQERVLNEVLGRLGVELPVLAPDLAGLWAANPGGPHGAAGGRR